MDLLLDVHDELEVKKSHCYEDHVTVEDVFHGVEPFEVRADLNEEDEHASNHSGYVQGIELILFNH